MIHELKTHPFYFEGIISGKKRFEIRKDDRDNGFAVDDVLWLREYDRTTETYSGRFCYVTVTFVMDYEQFSGIADGYVVMAIQLEWGHYYGTPGANTDG